MPFALQIDEVEIPDAELRRSLLGLTLPLRLALTAQASGAVAIVTESERITALLRDHRLTIPITKQRPSGVFLYRSPANLLVHRGYISTFAKVRGDKDAHLLDDKVEHEVPFGFTAFQINTPQDRKQGRKAVQTSLRKLQDGWTSTWLNRPISLFFSRFLVELPFHPNHVSFVILGIGLVGSYLASRGDYQSQALGALLFHAQSVLDGCDGEMSRLTFQGSKTGEWLDTVGDDITNYSFFGCAGYGLYTSTQNPLYLAAGATCVVCGLITSAIEYRYLIKIGSGDLNKYPIGVGKAGDNTSETFMDKISPLFKRDTFVFLTFLSAVFGVLSVALVTFALGAIGILLAVFKAEIRMAKERSMANQTK